jgi:hypothetical protein
MGDPEHDETASYSYRPSVLGAVWSFRLASDGLHWDNGRRSGRVPYSTITGVRMSYRPVSMQSRRFLTEIWSTSAPKLSVVSTSWKSMVEQVALDREYRHFIGVLHRRLAAAGPRVAFRAGIQPAVFWIGVAMAVAASLGLAGLAIRAIQFGSGVAAVMIIAFLALFLWQVTNYFRRNQPAHYSPQALPEKLMPPPG